MVRWPEVTTIVTKAVEIVRRRRRWTGAEIVVESTRGRTVEVEAARWWSRVEIRRRWTRIEVRWHAGRNVGIEVIRVEVVGSGSKVIWPRAERVWTAGVEIVWPVVEVVRARTKTVRWSGIEVCGREIVVGTTKVRRSLIEVEIFLLATESESLPAIIIPIPAGVTTGVICFQFPRVASQPGSIIIDGVIFGGCPLSVAVGIVTFDRGPPGRPPRGRRVIIVVSLVIPVSLVVFGPELLLLLLFPAFLFLLLFPFSTLFAVSKCHFVFDLISAELYVRWREYVQLQ